MTAPLPEGVRTSGDPGAPGVLLLHPWWGVTPAVLWWADQLVSAGRRVVLPDLFGGRPPPAVDVRTRRVDLHVAPADPWFEDEELAGVETGFGAAGSEVTVHRYEGAGHWFAEEGSSGHDAAATALARERVLDRLRTPAR